MCDLEIPSMRRPWPTLWRSGTGKKKAYIFASGGVHKVVFMHPIVALRTLGLHTAMLGVTEIFLAE